MASQPLGKELCSADRIIPATRRRMTATAAPARRSTPPGKPFLTADWRHLAMLNYRVAPDVLAPYLPRGTELDAWEGAHYATVVGMLFADTRVRGFAIPYHRTFQEVNLRFYVRREVAGEVRRGVVFVRELVPKKMIAAVARRMYNEPYHTVPMQHTVRRMGVAAEWPSLVEYRWQDRGNWSKLSVEPTGPAAPMMSGTREEFIAEHYWGYTRQRDGSTLEYGVSHPRWRLWPVSKSTLDGDLSELFGRDWAKALSGPAEFAMLAEGSHVTVHSAVKI
jgi:uncharacterized protein